MTILIDIGWYITTLRSPLASISTQKTPTQRHPRTVSVPSLDACTSLITRSFFLRRALARSQILRATSGHSLLPPNYYQSISSSLSKGLADGTFLKDGPPNPKGDGAPTTPPNPLSDPAAMDGMMAGMKTQMVMMVPQMLIMGWINFFFQGFVLSTSSL